MVILFANKILLLFLEKNNSKQDESFFGTQVTNKKQESVVLM
mgnify:CR=1 FL=1